VGVGGSVVKHVIQRVIILYSVIILFVKLIAAKAIIAINNKQIVCAYSSILYMRIKVL
jgi:hypothetical protein